MQIEMYAPSDARRIAALRREIQAKTDPERQLLEELGFNHLVPLIPKSSDQLDEIFDQLTPEEAKAWRWFLVKSWPRNNGSWRSFSRQIPLQVLQAIPEVTILFDNLEIWEPHDRSHGCLLIGMIYHPAQEQDATDYFVIARWSSSFFNLPFDKLREDMVEMGRNQEQKAIWRHRRRGAWLIVYTIIVVAVFVSIVLR